MGPREGAKGVNPVAFRATGVAQTVEAGSEFRSRSVHAQSLTIRVKESPSSFLQLYGRDPTQRSEFKN